MHDAHAGYWRVAAVALWLVAVGLAPAAPARGFAVALYVRNPTDRERLQEPLASGIPLPPGAVADPGALRVYDAAGKAVPCQAHQLGLCWPDGSLRWVLVQFQATVRPRSVAAYTLRVNPAAPVTPPPQRVTVTDTPAAVVVNTGPLRFSVSRGHFALLGGLAVAEAKAGYRPVVRQSQLTLVADREHMTLAEFAASGQPAKALWQFGLADTGEVKWGKVQSGVDYSASLAGPVRVMIEEAGPLRAVLRLESAAEKREGEVGFVARLYAFAGKPYVRVEYTLESYEQFLPGPAVEGYPQAIVNNKHLRRFDLRLGLSGPARVVEYGLPTGAFSVAAENASALRQLTPQACSLVAGANTPQTADRAPGWMSVTCGGHRLALATKWFWEVAPRGLSYDAARHEVALELHPPTAPAPGYPLAAGRVKTYEFIVGVDTPGATLSLLARDELHAYPDPEYVAGTGAAPRFVALTDKHFPGFAAYVANSRRQDTAARLYGDVDFGDQIGWKSEERWNGYHGVTHEWFGFYLASGEPELFQIAEQQVWHSLDVDTQHWGYQPGCREAEYARQHDHVCAALYQGGIKLWCLGEADYYLLTGRRRVLESLARSARFLLGCGGMSQHHYLPERATSLPFLHLVHLYEVLGDEGALHQAWPRAMKAGAGKFRRDSLGAEFSASCLATFKEVSDFFNQVYDEGKHVQCSFLASYPAEALHRYYLLTGDPGGKAGVLKAARFLYQDLALPTGIIKYAGGPPWDALSPWMPWWDGVEAPAALAYDLTGDKQYLEWGKAPVDWILNLRRQAYSSSPWAWQGAMGFGGTLGTYLWALRKAGLTQDDIVKPRSDRDYAQALATCQAECEKHRDRAMQNTGESQIFCRLAAEIGRVLIGQGRYDEAISWLEPWSKAPYGVYPGWALARARELQAAGKP